MKNKIAAIITAITVLAMYYGFNLYSDNQLRVQRTFEERVSAIYAYKADGGSLEKDIDKQLFESGYVFDVNTMPFILSVIDNEQATSAYKIASSDGVFSFEEFEGFKGYVSNR
jgi:hypothetical protein